MMIGFAAETLVELEVGAKTGAADHEKTALRLAQCNGDCDRDRETRATGQVGMNQYALNQPGPSHAMKLQNIARSQQSAWSASSGGGLAERVSGGLVRTVEGIPRFA